MDETKINTEEMIFTNCKFFYKTFKTHFPT